ncbi:MAG: hypothetical protein QOG64_1958 [Acidimicrobiaceae bacterium]|nr:hypothetical protein [Acidimicrobiaceae bacterium]
MKTRRVIRWRARAIGALGVSAAAAISLALPAAPAMAASDHGNRPPGNNGTIKIDEFPMDGGNGDDPHVDCRFSVNFFGYDGGTRTAKLTFAGQAPTGGGVLQESTTSWTTDRRTSGNQFDATVGPIDLTEALAKAGVSPAKQGYHIKLTVNVTGSQGSDAKHKVFWLKPCASPASPAPAPAPAKPSVSPATATPAASATASPAAPGAPAAFPAIDQAPPDQATLDALGQSKAGVAVMGETVAAAQAPAAVEAARTSGQSPTNAVDDRSSDRGSLPFTGARLLLLVACGLALVAAGTVALRTARSRP